MDTETSSKLSHSFTHHTVQYDYRVWVFAEVKERISQRSATKVESHGLFEGEADGREVSDAWTHLNVREGCAQGLAIPAGNVKRSQTMLGYMTSLDCLLMNDKFICLCIEIYCHFGGFCHFYPK